MRILDFISWVLIKHSAKHWNLLTITHEMNFPPGQPPKKKIPFQEPSIS